MEIITFSSIGYFYAFKEFFILEKNSLMIKSSKTFTLWPFSKILIFQFFFQN